MQTYLEIHRRKILKEIKEIEREIRRLPEGSLQVHVNKKYYRWYHEKNGQTKYLPKKEFNVARLLARKQYLLLRKNYLLDQLYSINHIIDACLDSKIKLDEFISSSRFSALLQSTIPQNKQINNWNKQSYETNPNYKSQLTFTCPSGNVVRSKSEVFIDMALHQKSIPYRYECKLLIGDREFYPDFTLIHPLTKEIIYWEHFGKMDDADYANKAMAKMKLYHSAGIIPGKNLIITFETKDRPFTFNDAMAALVQYGL
ncbi:hypothetical protein SAMN04487829_2430 [Pseudobutyrivibrio sp. NOR37]|nr:hypothetical protein SAMN04487829_2430 [Pseudobutyrivibrio sp. NOR37]